MSNNGNGYSKFSIAGLCISLVAPFLVVPFGYIALAIYQLVTDIYKSPK